MLGGISMCRRKDAALLAAGIMVGAAMTNTVAQAAEKYLTATPSTQTFYANGQQVDLEAYAIEGHNYVKLRDVGQVLGFEVSYDAAADSVYIGQAAEDTETVQLPTDGSQYVPQVGDVIRCNDGTDYTITDVSRWKDNGALPVPTCDWSSFPEVELPEPEVRHFTLETGDYLFIRNVYETRRMQDTLMDLAGNDPETSENGQLRYGSKGTPLVRISLTIDDSLTPQSFWPWRESELQRLFDSCPPGSYSMEAWDVYKDGVFQRTEYRIYAI
jgi:hypothetical protein